MSRYPIVKLDAQGRKKCPVCKQFKKLNEYPSQAGSRLGVHSYCSTCLNAYRRTRYTAERSHRWNVQTNVVRGLLCRSCNLFVWDIENDPKRLEAVLAYLAKHLPEAK